MTKKQRQIVLLIFITLFLITTPVILLYTAGFRYNFKKNKIQKIGTFVISTEPKEVNISINNKNFKKDKKTIIKNFLPDDYNIKINKDGYHDWKNTLTIKPQKSTFITNLILFKKSTPNSIFDPKSSSWWFPPKQDFIIFAKNNAIFIYDIKQKKQREIFNLPQKAIINDIKFSPDASKLILNLKKLDKNNNDYYYINITYKDNRLLKSPSNRIDNVKWHNINSQIVYIQSKNKIIKYDLINDIYTPLFTIKNINSFEPVGSNVYFLIQDFDKHKTFLYSYDNKDNSINIKQTLPLSKNYQITYHNQAKELLINDNENKICYIMSKTKNSLKTKLIIPNINKCLYNEKINLICHNNFEIFYLANNTKKLIGRYSNPIETIKWYDGYRIILLVNDSLNIIDLNQSEPFYIKLLNLEKITDFIVSRDKQYIYFNGQKNKKKKFYSLAIQ
jgi:hypothetical protein